LDWKNIVGEEDEKIIKREKRDFEFTTIDNLAKTKMTVGRDPVEEKASGPDLSQVEWEPFYKFNHIIMARVIQKLKIYQTIFTTGMGGYSVYCYVSGDAGITTILANLFLCSLATTMLFVVGNICRRLVGFAYMSSDGKWIKMATLSFTGKRKDTVHHVSDFGFIDRQPMYYRVFVSGHKRKYYYIVPKMSQLLDKNKFVQVFGERIEFTPNEKQKSLRETIYDHIKKEVEAEAMKKKQKKSVKEINK